MLEKIGKYEIRLQVGRGGMGIVYEGFDPSIGRRVAIKTLRTENIEPEHLPEFLARFKREAQSAGRLSHPNIITIHEYGEQDGMPYIVMEYINGHDLAADLKRGLRFALDDVVRIMTQLLGALQHAHEQGVVHRDIKPPNVLILDDGSLKVVDFGIARIEDSEAFTKTGAVMGTPAYMSPEQILGLPVTAKSDLFSAGTLLYQLLTGDRPFTGDEYSVKQKVLKQLPIAPSELNPTLAAPWDAVVARAMAKKPEARYESARQFLESIRAAHEAERRGSEDARRKAADAEEHARRSAEERSTDEARQREEHAHRLIERKEREEAEVSSRAEAARRKAEETVRRKADETVAMPVASPPASRKPLFVALGIAAAIAVLGAILYQRDDSAERAAKAEAARSAEALARQQAEQAAKSAEQRAAEAKRETEKLTQAQADERARLESERLKKESEEKTKAEALKKEEEAKRKTELAAKLAADLQAKKDTEAKAKQDAEAKARQEADEKAKADAARKAEEAKREAQRPGKPFRDCEGCPEMVAVPAGSFTMGSPDPEEGRFDREGPQRRVTIARPFAASRHEVTFDEWDACVRESGCSHNLGDLGWGRGRRPVINVSWQDARQFAEWLSRKTGKRYRLLTEAEWEYAARAGTATAYTTGATIATSQANFGNSRKQTVPVGSYGPNAFGLFDVHGNVWEWTEDCWNASYAGAPSDGSAWLAGDCSLRVSRGGSWHNVPRSVRSAIRVRTGTALRHDDLGFRLARTLE